MYSENLRKLNCEVIRHVFFAIKLFIAGVEKSTVYLLMYVVAVYELKLKK